MCKYTDAKNRIDNVIRLFRNGLLSIPETLNGMNIVIDNFLTDNYKMDPDKKYKAMNRLYINGMKQIIKYSKGRG